MKAAFAVATLFALVPVGLGQSKDQAALEKYHKTLEANPASSEAHYRIAEVFFDQNNLPSAANELSKALRGDLQPRWTEVWSHILLGNIFDVAGQRERGIMEYKRALKTNDNARGALDAAAKYLRWPYHTGFTPMLSSFK